MEKILALIMSAVLGLLGIAFMVAKPAMLSRIIIGIILLAFAALVLFLTFRKKEQVVIKQEIEIGATVDKKILKCNNCGAEIPPESIRIEKGVAFVNCDYCKASYRLEEAPKW